MYGWAMSQSVALGCFKWVIKISQCNEDFIKSYNDDGDEEYFIEVDVNII